MGFETTTGLTVNYHINDLTLDTEIVSELLGTILIFTRLIAQED